MINFRYHLVSLAAVLLSLAAGVALGAGVLDESSSSTTSSGDTRVDPAVQAFDAAFADSAAPAFVANTLTERRIVIITTPGARTAEVEDLAARVTAAGGTVVGEVALTAKLLESNNRQFAESVAQQSAPEVPGVAEGGDSYDRVGAALARSMMSPEGGPLDETATTIRSAFDQGGLIDLPDAPDQSADLALVVVGPSPADDARGDILADITAQLTAAGGAAAVVGPSVTSVGGGVLDLVRNSDEIDAFATADVTETAAGRVLAVWALAQAAGGTTGSWGTSRSADGQLPQ